MACQVRHNSAKMNTVVLFVPQQEAWVIERMGKFNRVLQPVSIQLQTGMRIIMILQKFLQI